MTEEQRAAIERLRRVRSGELIIAVYTGSSQHASYMSDVFMAKESYLAEHPSGEPSVADELREARRLLKRVVYSCDPRGEGIDEHDCQNIVTDADAFLARTSRF